MIKKLFFISGIYLISIPLSVIAQDEPVPVDTVILEKYAGVWYEIAKIPNRFQSSCHRNTTATYTINKDGNLEVVNKCLENDGGINEARGIAKVVDKKSNAILKVSFVNIFGLYLFWGDYWILGLEKDYNYAIVGTPGREYGWILCRNPVLSEEDLQKVYAELRMQGYDPATFEMTKQDY